MKTKIERICTNCEYLHTPWSRQPCKSCSFKKVNGVYTRPSFKAKEIKNDSL